MRWNGIDNGTNRRDNPGVRILFSRVFNPRFEHLPEYITAAFRGLGHEVVEHDYRGFALPGRLREACGVLDRWDRRRLNRGLLEVARRFKSDLFLTTFGGSIEPATVEAIRRETGAAAANWFADFPGAPGVLERGLWVGHAYNRLFFQSTDLMGIHAAWGHRRVSWLPPACDPDIHRPVVLAPEERRRYGCAVAFVGSRYPERERLFETIADLDVGIWGPGWDALRPGSPLVSRIRGGGTKPEDWTKIYAAASVVVHFAGSGGQPVLPDTMKQAGPRVFEILACGAFGLMDRKPDTAALFLDGEHLAFFDGESDFRSKVLEWLGRPTDRARIAAAGRAEALAKHTYRHRVSEMLRILAEDRG